jgi:hypothetical protein
MEEFTTETLTERMLCSIRIDSKGRKPMMFSPSHHPPLCKEADIGIPRPFWSRNGFLHHNIGVILWSEFEQGFAFSFRYWVDLTVYLKLLY